MLQQLTRAVSKTRASYELLQTEHRELAVELQAAEQERAALAAQFASKAAALDDLEARHQAACAYGKELQGMLDSAAARSDRVMQAALETADRLAEKVGAGCLGGGGCWVSPHMRLARSTHLPSYSPCGRACLPPPLPTTWCTPCRPS